MLILRNPSFRAERAASAKPLEGETAMRRLSDCQIRLFSTASVRRPHRTPPGEPSRSRGTTLRGPAAVHARSELLATIKRFI
jgi:hypothetical protein